MSRVKKGLATLFVGRIPGVAGDVKVSLRTQREALHSAHSTLSALNEGIKRKELLPNPVATDKVYPARRPPKTDRTLVAKPTQ